MAVPARRGGRDPDPFLFRDYDEGLAGSIRTETELFVESVFRSERSVLELVTANYTFLNERLAEHYGIPHVRGSQFRRVEVPAESARGGLLGQGSILTVTSYPTRTSPVLRGKFVLDNLLAAPPPPPPPDVPALVAETAPRVRNCRCARRWQRIARTRVRELPRPDGSDRLRARAVRRRRPVA